MYKTRHSEKQICQHLQTRKYSLTTDMKSIVLMGFVNVKQIVII